MGTKSLTSLAWKGLRLVGTAVLGLILALNLLPAPVAQAWSGKTDNPLNLPTGWSGSFNPRGWAITLDTERGPIPNTSAIAQYNPLLSNADLSDLTLSSGPLAPPFASGTTTYTANVVNNTHQILVTPTAVNPSATIMVNGGTVASGNASQPINLAVGENSIYIIVTAEDGVTVKMYSVTVKRDAFVVYLPHLTR